ncbi:hypothetical protein M3B43_06715 [Nesterenkonia massiliensis]|uniref:Uncharacterized protein n=1 Tax=Nesterenkonia massiliensis TaxID=1232429 RepID=A0ABT2HR51_9MICC|nr:hypothetical protein [Nesterenkonia massiliensis]MCT1607024.1 hypothetical protein [Nesterenkonia massiliensis]
MGTRMTVEMIGREVVFEFADPYGEAFRGFVEDRIREGKMVPMEGTPVLIDGDEPEFGKRASVVLSAESDARFETVGDTNVHEPIDGMTKSDAFSEFRDELKHFGSVTFSDLGVGPGSYRYGDSAR